MGSEEFSARAELEAALQRAKEATKEPVPRMSSNPDTRTAEAQLKVSKLETALDTLEGTSGAVVEVIKNALMKAKAAAQEKPITDLITECKVLHRAGRKTTAELGGGEIVRERVVGGRPCTACPSGSP